MPAWAQPKVQYGICVVTASTHKTDAQAFVKRVLGKAGQAKLRAAGFLPRVKKKCAARRALVVAYVAAALVALAFLLLPIVAIFARTSPAHLVEQLSNPVVTDALVVSLKTSLIAQAADRRCSGRPLRSCSRAGASAAARSPSRSSSCRSSCRRPSRASACSPRSAASACSARASARSGSRSRSRRRAVTIAVAYVASPLYIRQAIAAFEATDPNLAAASRTLGAGPVRTFFRVVLPLARGGLIAGLALSFARGLGEFGATIMFAGSLQKVTQTLPLAIYAEFDRRTSTRRSR